MPYLQVKKLLEQGMDFHKMLEEFYLKLENESDKDSVKLLVNYMARHEKILREQLGQITTEQQKILAEEWLKSSPEFVGKCCFENLQVHKDSSTDEVIDEGLRLNQCLIDF